MLPTYLALAVAGVCLAIAAGITDYAVAERRAMKKSGGW